MHVLVVYSCEKFNLNHMSLQDPRHCTSSQLHLNLGHDAISTNLTVLNTLKISAHRGDPNLMVSPPTLKD